MYLFYNNTGAFAVDAYEPALIKAMLSRKLEHGKVYSKTSLFNQEELERSRELYAADTTHHHFDHSGGNEELSKMFPNVKFYTGTNTSDYQIITCINAKIKCIKTPSHTMDSVCYVVDDRYVLTGDFLFKLGCGKFFEGNASMFVESVNKLKTHVSKNAILLYGHDYTHSNLGFAYTIRKYTNEELSKILNTEFLTFEDELNLNVFLEAQNEKEVEKLRNKKDAF
ncbi:GLO2 [Enterospora canceri]|uniref:GLO2 n=1 Tax=Enterospora canceri TaxID=1081671 RepID=A0A1Y1S706_9MICR|nr:GLO2 [Enterospora canceri]